MMSHVYSFDDDDHLEALLTAVRGRGIDISSGGLCPDGVEDLYFRRGCARIHGAVYRDVREVYLGGTHPLNPFLWYFDGRLYADVESTFQEHGSVQLNPDSLTPLRND